MATGQQYDTELVVDYSGDEPEHQARLTLNLEDVQELKHIAYEAGWLHSVHTHNRLKVRHAAAVHEFFFNLERQLERPSLFSMTDFKATKDHDEHPA